MKAYAIAALAALAICPGWAQQAEPPDPMASMRRYADAVNEAEACVVTQAGRFALTRELPQDIADAALGACNALVQKAVPAGGASNPAWGDWLARQHRRAVAAVLEARYPLKKSL